MTAHVFITGTGRAGTSFLVELFGACGLDVGDLATTAYFASADAGYEHRPHETSLPYVVKSPELHQFLDEIDLSSTTVDAVVVPVRDLRAAARSRILQERATAGWSLDESSRLTVVSTTAGGALTSLSLDDQERLLAVGQARIIQWAVTNDLPLYLIDFPRIVDDAEYCIDRLWPVLSPHTTRPDALAAHGRVARPDKVRIRPGDPTLTETDPEELRLRIAALEKAITDLHTEGAGPMTNLRTMLALDARTTAMQKLLRRLAKHVGMGNDD
ncbi:MAG: hypothetical protein RLZ04_1023 [Actinomycetota bacterium]